MPESGTGKTRLLEIHAALCYRPLFLVGNVTGAALFRSINLVQGTLVIDESDLKSSEAWSDVVKVLNNGYSRGGSVIRCNKDNGYATEAFTSLNRQRQLILFVNSDRSSKAIDKAIAKILSTGLCGRPF